MVVEREKAPGFVLDEQGKAHQRFKEKAGKSQFECCLCGERFHGKKDPNRKKGWIPDLTQSAPPAMPPEAVEDDPEEVSEQEQGERYARLRAEYDIPLGAFDIESDGTDCLYAMWLMDRATGEKWTEVFLAERREP